jgi:acetyl-CoA acetyltransferase
MGRAAAGVPAHRPAPGHRSRWRRLALCSLPRLIASFILQANGGAIAVGHPLGMSGARLVTTLPHELQERSLRRGAATLCVGVGQGVAAILERA